MLRKNKAWSEIRRWAASVAISTQFETLTVSLFLPVLEAIFINLYTGIEADKSTPYLIAILALCAIHGVLLALLLIRQNSNPIQIAADQLELQYDLEEARAAVKATEAELSRKSDSYKTLRTVLETLNLQTCGIDISDVDAFKSGLLPIIQRLACNARGTLGVVSDHYTIEVYCLPYFLGEDYDDIAVPGLFYSSAGIEVPNDQLVNARSAFHWGWNREVPGVCCTASDKLVFYDGERPRDGLYFRQFATVPITEVCSSERAGLLVVTSMQEEPFQSDVIETMQFFASVVSQYLASHLRCLTEWQEREAEMEAEARREEQRQRRQQTANRRSALASQIPTSPDPAESSGGATETA